MVPPIVNKQNCTDRMVEYLRLHATVPVVWQYGTLRSQACLYPERLLYYKTDTHCNNLGALAGLDGIFQALDMPPPAARTVNLLHGPRL